MILDTRLLQPPLVSSGVALLAAAFMFGLYTERGEPTSAESKTSGPPYTCVILNEWSCECMTEPDWPVIDAQFPPSATVPAVIAPTPVLTARDAYMKANGKIYYGICVKSLQSLPDEYGTGIPVASGKWDTDKPSQGNLDFGSFDTFVNYTKANGEVARGHTFVRHSQFPSWVSGNASAARLTAAIQNHIFTVAEHYPGKINEWDVVNGILNDDGTFRDSIFYNILGISFVPIAFKTAWATDPTTKLYITEPDINKVNAKLKALFNLIKREIAACTPIDGISIGGNIRSELELPGGAREWCIGMSDAVVKSGGGGGCAIL